MGRREGDSGVDMGLTVSTLVWTRAVFEAWVGAAWSVYVAVYGREAIAVGKTYVCYVAAMGKLCFCIAGQIAGGIRSLIW